MTQLVWGKDTLEGGESQIRFGGWTHDAKKIEIGSKEL